MRKLVTILITIVLSYTSLYAQETYTLTATVTRIKHNTAVTDDQVTQGTFYFKQSGQMCLTFHEGKEQLLMDGTSFIMINDEKSSVAKGKNASHLELLQQVLQNILLGGGGHIDTVVTGDMQITNQDNSISITPVDTGTKATRRMMFTSFTLTIDSATSQLKSMCMYEKGGNYTQYEFSNYVFNE